MSQYSLEEILEPQPTSDDAFGRYRLAYQLASGGMGTVFLARAAGPAGFEKLVALKRIHPHMATDRRFVSMFLDEARIAAQIQHPNVCSVIDFGEVDGSYFLTMPFILGESMNRVIGTAARLPAGDVVDLLPLVAARLVADACEGLHAAHELRDEEGRLREVVHRDVSPHNLMVGYDGVVRVLDFGVASARDRHYQTTTGEVKGKFAYLAPEQIEAQKVDRRADVWALGVVLWEAVTARRLFARESMAATIRCVSTMRVPSVRELRPGAPESLDHVVQRALARDPAERYPTARAMGRDLVQVLAREDRFVGAADVADWMVELFPDGLRAQERLVEATRTGKVAPPPPAPDALDQSSVQRRDTTPSVERTALLDEASHPSAFASHLPSAPEGSDPSALASRPPSTPAIPHPSAFASQSPSASEISRPSAFASGSPSMPEIAQAPPLAPAPTPASSRLALVAVVLGLLALAAVGAAVGAFWMTRPDPEMVAVELPSPPAAQAPEAPPVEVPAPEPVAPRGQVPPVAEPVAERPEPPAVAAAEPSVPAPAERAPPAEPPPAQAAAPSAPARAPAPAREARARPRGEGTLTVATPGGWALVFLGSRPLGEAPGVFTVPAGAHTVFIQPFGRGPRIRHRVVVRADQTARISQPLSN